MGKPRPDPLADQGLVGSLLQPRQDFRLGPVGTHLGRVGTHVLQGIALTHQRTAVDRAEAHPLPPVVGTEQFGLGHTEGPELIVLLAARGRLAVPNEVKNCHEAAQRLSWRAVTVPPKDYQVLVIDDDASMRDLVKAFLDNAGMGFMLAEDGPRGLELAKAHAANFLIIGHPKSGNTWLKVMISR